MTNLLKKILTGTVFCKYNKVAVNHFSPENLVEHFHVAENNFFHSAM